MVRLRMMTFLTPAPRKKPPPTISPLVPAPTMVLFDLTLSSVPFGVIVMGAPTLITYGSVAVTYLVRSARFVTVTVVPVAPPVVPPPVEAKPSGVDGQVRSELVVTGVNAHCLLLFAVQVSWMIAAPFAVEAPWSEMHRPLPTLMIWNVSVPDAATFHCWLVCEPA